jgi:heme-degrading monooxygenase HmoA
MIVRIYWGRIEAGALPDIERVYRNYDVDSVPGLLARFVSQDLNDPDSLYVITIWKDLASVERWVASEEYRERITKPLKPFIVGAHSLSLSAVRVEDLAGLARRMAGPASE